MTAFIALGDGRSWWAANWAYDAAIRYIADELPPTHEGIELKEWLQLRLCEHCGPGLGSVDVRELTPEDRALFEEAALSALVTLGETPPQDWHDSKAFPGWHRHFKVLAQLIGSVRNGEPPGDFNPHAEGLIEASGDRVGPGWTRLSRRRP